MTREQIEQMDRDKLIQWLENARGMACYDDESTELLRQCALEDFDSCGKEEGFAS